MERQKSLKNLLKTRKSGWFCFCYQMPYEWKTLSCSHYWVFSSFCSFWICCINSWKSTLWRWWLFRHKARRWWIPRLYFLFKCLVANSRHYDHCWFRRLFRSNLPWQIYLCLSLLLRCFHSFNNNYSPRQQLKNETNGKEILQCCLSLQKILGSEKKSS